MIDEKVEKGAMTFEKFKEQVLVDYKLACISREASLLGRKEVLTGKAKFGIFGDGKELAQIAMAKQFMNGDFRSGYYRDQTFMMAIGQLTVQQYFAALYAHTDVELEPASGGRQMGGHYSTRNLNADGSWKELSKQKNSSADVSPTASQMPRLLGLAQASKLFKKNENLHRYTNFSNKGNEIAFGTIGDASTSEGIFWETINAAGVLQVPMLMSVWDDGYGISVPKKYQTTKESISEALKGMQRDKNKPGYEIFKAKGWNYGELCGVYEKAAKLCREEHIPVLVHVEEVTQPQGHSTSGSHERYKSAEVLQWTKDYDCINQFKLWILAYEKDFGLTIATEEELNDISEDAKNHVRTEQKKAWDDFTRSINGDLNELSGILNALAETSGNKNFILKIAGDLKATLGPIRKDVISAARRALRYVRNENSPEKQALVEFIQHNIELNYERYSSYLYSESAESALRVEEVKPEYGSNAQQVDGRLILRDNFDKNLEKNPLVLVFGEDSGFIGDVNQGLEGMQTKYGELRVADTGIREATILGQGIGLAMRGLRPIAEIQYLDYLLYALQIMSDDLATVQYRTKGGQKAPLIIRTRGHRLEGIWHSGSPMGMIVHACRGIYVCVPRNCTDAAGFYNTLLASDDCGLIVEPLNGYRKKELMPSNLAEFKTPLGVPEVVIEGSDLTIVSYGSTFNICHEIIGQLNEVGISAELIDVRTLLPFDINHTIVESLKKTNRLLVVDEDVPGGASAYMLDKILVEQGGYQYLDSKPVTLAAKEHRPAYGSDGDYFSKPSAEDIFEAVYAIMHEADPSTYPALYA
ncbi:MAG TPA: thiamine pyrophosphate-dependent enzyme [Flavobacteriales bacterium]|nr:thiamine pyrophosphate-dependent enzyme [Flavobacteriales bacterium]